jgi:chemotaxis family two-component system response regulator Rcp1
MNSPSNLSDTVEVLHIEDNPTDFLLTQHVLAACQTKFSSRQIDTGDEAEQVLLRMAKGEEPKPDMILLDLDLPQVSGHELLKIIKGENELGSIPVIILTGLVYAESLLGGYHSTVDLILNKPFNATEYLETAQNIERVWMELGCAGP